MQILNFPLQISRQRVWEGPELCYWKPFGWSGRGIRGSSMIHLQIRSRARPAPAPCAFYSSALATTVTTAFSRFHRDSARDINVTGNTLCDPGHTSPVGLHSNKSRAERHSTGCRQALRQSEGSLGWWKTSQFEGEDGKKSSNASNQEEQTNTIDHLAWKSRRNGWMRTLPLDTNTLIWESLGVNHHICFIQDKYTDLSQINQFSLETPI